MSNLEYGVTAMAVTDHRMRLAERNDLPRLREITEEAYGTAALDLTTLINEENLFVAQWRTAIDGFMVMLPLSNCLLVHRLAVAKDARGRGIGSWLLDCAAMHAHGLGLSAIELQVSADGRAARIEWLTRKGFVPQRQGGNRIYLRRTVAP